MIALCADHAKALQPVKAEPGQFAPPAPAMASRTHPPLIPPKLEAAHSAPAQPDTDQQEEHTFISLAGDEVTVKHEPAVQPHAPGGHLLYGTLKPLAPFVPAPFIQPSGGCALAPQPQPSDRAPQPYRLAQPAQHPAPARAPVQQAPAPAPCNAQAAAAVIPEVPQPQRAAEAASMVDVPVQPQSAHPAHAAQSANNTQGTGVPAVQPVPAAAVLVPAGVGQRVPEPVRFRDRADKVHQPHTMCPEQSGTL